MEKRKLGRTELEVTPIVLGTWQYDSKTWCDIKDEESVRTVHAAMDLGVNLLDTAQGYGRSESVVGRALRGWRDRMQIMTKLFTPAARVEDAVDSSLRNLKTDYLDICAAHYPPAEGIPYDALLVLDRLRSEGKVRALGVSNFSLAQMEASLEAVRYDVCEPPYNLLWRQAELEGILDFCRANEIAVLTYSSLAQGLLAGRFLDGVVPDDIHAKNKLYAPGTFERCLEVAQLVRAKAEKYRVSMAQVALNWALGQPGVSACIAGAERPWQIEDAVGAVGWVLEEQDARELGAQGMAVARTLDYATNMWHWRPGL
jgi:aryl-alcohol dehydrogenase-like predicted oxidoreductase